MNKRLRHLAIMVGTALGAFTTAATSFAAASALPDSKTGGANGGPLAILFLGPVPWMDKGYAQELSRQGIVFANGSYFESLPYAFLKKFNVVVVDKLPQIGQEFDVFGQNMIVYWDNLKLVRRCAEEGAGVLIYTNLADGGGALCGGWNKEMKPWGIKIPQACIRDQARRVEPWPVYGAESYYSWTENLAKHPITEGLKRLYYPSANLRWDDCYTAPPLICDRNWTPLVMAMPGATAAMQVDDQWVDISIPAESLILSAVRPVGKGRMGVLSIHPYYIHQLGYDKRPDKLCGEMCPGVIDGIVLKKGDGSIPSDTGTFVTRLYAWLAGDSARAGFGGFKTGDPIEKGPALVSEEEKRFTPVLDFDHYAMPPAWRHRGALVKVGENQYYPEVSDPLVTGELKYFKALIGAHSKLSDGSGSVAEYAAESKTAGYSLIVFTETFEKLSRENWNELVIQCEKNSADDLICLPGMDIQDPGGNHLILIAPPEYPRASWLTVDGKRLEKTQMTNFLFYNHIVVAHRPAGGPLPYERIKHFQGLTVYTYRDGKVVDDGMKAYAWQVMNGSNPHPMVVHELFNPSEVAAASRTGFQQMMPSDTVKNAVAYFRIGTPHYFEAPVRYLISEGPVIYNWVSSPKDIGPASENREHFRVAVGVRGEVPLASVTLYDGLNPVRRWLPMKNDFQATADFQHSHQYGLYVVAEDTKGRRAITSSIRTVANRFHSRCGDRQNWLGHIAACYTGTFLTADGLDLRMRIKGTEEGSSAFSTDLKAPGACMAAKLNFPFTCNDVVLTESALDEKYVSALWPEVGLDAMPSRASQPSEVYGGRMRHYSFTQDLPDRPYVTLVEFDLTLKRAVEPVNPSGLFPVFKGQHGDNLRGKKLCRWEAEKLVAGDIPNNATLPVPEGALAGGFIPMSSGFQIKDGEFGLAPPTGNPAVIPAGARFLARFLIAKGCGAGVVGNNDKLSFDSAPEEWLRAMGFAGPTPYQLNLTRGKLEKIAFVAEMMPDHYGVAGQVATPANIPYQLPLRIRGLNERWSAGVWREDGRIAYTGVFEGTAWPRLDVSKPGGFYAGNLLAADHKDLVLEIVKWTKDAIKVEVHNPTDQPITATVSTPNEIANYRPLNQKVTVPAGATVYLEGYQKGDVRPTGHQMTE